MKTLVAQLWEDPKVVGDYFNRTDEVDQFWKPCLESVEFWAKTNNFDYKQYSFADLEHLLPDLTYVEELLTTNWNRICISKLGMLNNTDYDRIVVVDADIYAWDNPSLTDEKFCVYVGDRIFPPGCLGHPQGGVYYTTIGPQVYQWICNQLKNPGDHLQLLRNYLKYATTMFTSGDNHFGEQMLLNAYVNSEGYTDIDNHIFWGQDEVRPNSFIHFAGSKKLAKFQKFRAAMIYAKIDKFWEQNVYKLKSKGLV